MFIRYILFALIWIVLAVFQFFFGWALRAPWLAILRRDTYPNVLGWFQPDDTPAVGDTMYGEREAAFTKSYPIWLARYVRGVMWGCRNPAYGWLATRGVVIPSTQYEFSSCGNTELVKCQDGGNSPPLFYSVQFCCNR